MSAKVVLDGRVVEPDEARVSVFDRGFLYGDSVYEVVRTYGGRPFALDEHLERMDRSAALIGMTLPASRSAFAGEVRQGLSAADLPEAYIRIVVTRGAGPIGLDPALADRPVRMVLILPLVLPDPGLYRTGARVALVHPGPRAALLPTSESGTAKTGNYLVNVLAVREARARGAYEAFLVDATGHVSEGSSSNLFCVRDGRIVTPALRAGILEGITRRHVLRLAQEEGYVVEERDVPADALFEADEVFLTSTIRELVAVTEIDGRRIGGGAWGRVATALHRAFHEHAVRESR